VGWWCVTLSVLEGIATLHFRIRLGIVTLLARFARFVRNCHALGIPLRDHQKVDDFDDDIHNNNDDLKHSEDIQL
jgi:heme A synthase